MLDGYFNFCSERELVDEEENLYDTVPREEKEEGIYGTVVGMKKPLSPPKVRHFASQFLADAARICLFRFVKCSIGTKLEN